MTENEVVAHLVRLLSGSGNPRPFRGSELSVLLRASIPDFDPIKFNCRNLRDFIRKHASNEIMEISKAGMDIIYGLRSVGQQQPLFETPTGVDGTPKPHNTRAPLGQLLANPRIWKTFASPETPFRLFLAPSTGLIRTLRPGYSPDTTWLEIPRISAEKLLQIAKDYVAELPDAQRQPFYSILEQPKWWLPFFDLTRALGLKMRWVSFRRRRIAEEFERSLPTIPTVPTLPQPTEGGDESTNRLVVVRTTGAPAESSIKRIAAEVVQRMTESELRSLNLPLGYVIDAMTTR